MIKLFFKTLFLMIAVVSMAIAQSNKIAIILDENIFEGDWPKELADLGVYPDYYFDKKTQKFYNNSSNPYYDISALIKNPNIDLIFLAKGESKILFSKNIPLANHLIISNKDILPKNSEIKKLIINFTPALPYSVGSDLKGGALENIRNIINTENYKRNLENGNATVKLTSLAYFLNGFDKKGELVALKTFLRVLGRKKLNVSFQWKLNNAQEVIGCVFGGDIDINVKICEERYGIEKTINVGKKLCVTQALDGGYKYNYKVEDFNKCFNEVELKYAWTNNLKNECAQIYKDKVFRIVSNKKCERSIFNNYVDCTFSNFDQFSFGKIIKLKGEIEKNIGLNELNTKEVRDFFNKDQIGAQLFLQNLLDDFYIPCLQNNIKSKEKYEICNKSVGEHTTALLNTKKNDRALIEKIKNFFKERFLITLKRDMHGYHYTNYQNLKSDVNIDEKTRKKIALNYTNHLSAESNNLKNDNRDMAGPGFYLAIDPLSSQDFGQTLIKVNLRAGRKFLDVRYSSNDFPDNLKKDLEKKCGFKDQIYLASNFSYVLKKECEEIFVPVFKELGVDGLIYSYPESLDCDNRGGYAIVNWNPDITELEVLDKSITQEKKIKSNWNKSKKDYFELNNALLVKNKTNEQINTVSRIRKNVYGCDLKLHPEEAAKKINRILEKN